jgi:hypothetical protein
MPGLEGGIKGIMGWILPFMQTDPLEIEDGERVFSRNARAKFYRAWNWFCFAGGGSD